MGLGVFLEPAIPKNTGGTIQLRSDECNFITVAAAVATTLRLPAPGSPADNLHFVIHLQRDQDLTILPPLVAGYTGAPLLMAGFNNLAIASAAYTTAANRIGAVFECRTINGRWWIQNASPNTMTIA
jgi:hypothetical protein